MAGPFGDAQAVVQNAIAGDLIEVQRNLGYQHWTVYVGNLENVNPIYVGKENTIGVGAPSWRLKFKSRLKMKSVFDLCNTFQGMDCRVNNLDDVAKSRNLVLLSNGTIVLRALACFEKNLKIKYHVRFNNCEHFVTFCRYNFPISLQVENLPKLLRTRPAHLLRDRERLDYVTKYALQFVKANLHVL